MTIGKTQFKIILLISLLALFFTAILFVIKNNEENKLTKILVEERNTKKVLVDNIIDLVGKGLESWAFNDTYWDEMVVCVEKKDAGWGNEIIASALPTYNAYAAWLYQTDLSLAYSTNVNNDSTLKNLPLSKSELASLFSNNNFNHFFLYTKVGLLEIRTAPVQPSSDIKRKTPPKGYFFVARLWNQDYLNKLNLLTSSKTELHILSKKYKLATKNSANSIHISKTLKDFQGNPIAEISFTSESEMLKESATALNWQLITGVFLTVGLLMAISLFLIRYVLAPLKKISYSLEKEKSIYLEE